MLPLPVSGTPRAKYNAIMTQQMQKNSTVKSPFSLYSVETVLSWQDAGQNIFSSLPLDSPFSTLSSFFFSNFE